MSVLIKDMEKPKSCYAVIDGESEYCPFVNTDDDCVLLLKKGICDGTWEEQYSKCPLKEAAEPCEDAVSRHRLLNDLKELIAAWEKYPVMAEQIKGVETAIVYVQTIPSAQPEKAQLSQEDATFDCVSRQAAIDAFGLFADIQHVGEKTIRQILTDVPSGQPDIITCEYCKHWKNKHLCESLSRFGSFETKSDFYCGYAERRTDE